LIQEQKKKVGSITKNEPHDARGLKRSLPNEKKNPEYQLKGMKTKSQKTRKGSNQGAGTDSLGVPREPFHEGGGKRPGRKELLIEKTHLFFVKRN